MCVVLCVLCCTGCNRGVIVSSVRVDIGFYGFLCFVCVCVCVCSVNTDH